MCCFKKWLLFVIPIIYPILLKLKKHALKLVSTSLVLFESFEKVQIALFLINHGKVIIISVGAIQNDPLLLRISSSDQPQLAAPESWSKYWNWCFIIFVFITKKFFLVISDVFCWFHPWNHWKRFKINKKGWKRLKKVVQPDFGCVQRPKAGRNTQHVCYSF